MQSAKCAGSAFFLNPYVSGSRVLTTSVQAETQAANHRAGMSRPAPPARQEISRTGQMALCSASVAVLAVLARGQAGQPSFLGWNGGSPVHHGGFSCTGFEFTASHSYR
ncbi:uncharacterized protein BO95DRAFT_268293 [Aspergillus brunneoviolaceus CBS 621.78]|uniref:Uncharacterized protein n=1 Tax=Aspergillus brunneoviolaceus CBS 621.78 TaxID=1450534 RepID=A0ACD1GJW4_9EURO|nr:hypothetical protein BO95DRAFT_268293 [Aspergillus brunneoviolaceus CBS 621.78]RAH49517.1 hypothetical protein BO95DRAFT_268293 [Aspergillus brunneoviolaceus CBS 621.78]